MIIRHAGKPAASGAPYGITADGTHDSRALTVQGWTRASAGRLFDPRDSDGATVAPRPGLSHPATALAA
jgi:hypothetical protein